MKSFSIGKREVDIVIISDIHLGAFGCHAKELLQYMRSIRPKMLILNGDIVDIWQFRKAYFPKSHLMVIRHLTGLIAKNTKVVYITGNHDELMRKFVKFNLGSFKLVNKLLLDLHGKKTWIFHGDVFANFIITSLGREKISFSKRVKHSVKTAVSYINKFEETAAGIAISKGYSYVICGHIHQPEMRKISNSQGEVMYLNSGDWVENLSSLEYQDGEWRIYNYREDPHVKAYTKASKQLQTFSHKETFQNLLKEFELK